VREKYLVCPKCGIANKGWKALVKEYCWTVWEVQGDELVDVDQEYDGVDMYEVEHECGFKEKGEIYDFMIDVENGEIVSVGRYWVSHMNDLKRLLGGRFKIPNTNPF